MAGRNSAPNYATVRKINNSSKLNNRAVIHLYKEFSVSVFLQGLQKN